MTDKTNCPQWLKDADTIERLTAERDELKDAANKCRLAFAGYIDARVAVDALDAALAKLGGRE